MIFGKIILPISSRTRCGSCPVPGASQDLVSHSNPILSRHVDLIPENNRGVPCDFSGLPKNDRHRFCKPGTFTDHCNRQGLPEIRDVLLKILMDRGQKTSGVFSMSFCGHLFPPVGAGSGGQVSETDLAGPTLGRSCRFGGYPAHFTMLPRKD